MAGKDQAVDSTLFLVWMVVSSIVTALFHQSIGIQFSIPAVIATIVAAQLLYRPVCGMLSKLLKG